jgi:ribosomal protein S12 methylthiotransferase
MNGSALHYAFPTGFRWMVLELMKREPKICNYIDIPLQHISDSILKSMRRGTTQAKKQPNYLRILERCSRYGNSYNFNRDIPEKLKKILRFWKICSRNEILIESPTHMRKIQRLFVRRWRFWQCKQDRANEIMELQSQISWDLNQELASI